ncbi:NAD(P)-binding protein [Coniophora puteana RWD-64-598 SS2]|uniref:NAD(P)-binding protein n=1 Tax=Coniophora puteana (strain RWD-64-598) TaxID=741705 RepID=A0A5M3MAD2_CONPW|nr:NAD(P)-binding protein [Coniophora puteana RWD-64-598 SS2]EIW75916.1 NAD(P)-binding protein [Coniophora puteana RWD-64-598 SS2]
MSDANLQPPRVWFSSSSGLGKAMAEVALMQGDSVVATLRRPELLAELSQIYHPSKLFIIELDVTDKRAVEAAFARAREQFGHIDVVYNNAGAGYFGEVESMDEESARTLFEVNFWGATYVSKEAIRFFREVNRPMGGHLLQASSLAAAQAVPGLSYYSAAKAALESLTEAIAFEIHPSWNIKVSCIQFGPFNTTIAGSHFKRAPIYTPYRDETLGANKAFALFSNDATFTGHPTKAAQMMYMLSLLDNPPLRLPLHSMAVDWMRNTLEATGKDLETYKSWSDDLYCDE